MRHIRAPFNRPALFEEGVSEVPDRYGQQSARHHHGFSQMDVVASLGALLRWNRLFVAVHLVPVRRGAAKGETRTSFVAR